MANNAIVLRSQSSIANPPADAPRLIFPGVVITSDSFATARTIAGSATDAANGGLPFVYNNNSTTANTIVAASGNLDFSAAASDQYVGFNDLTLPNFFVSFKVAAVETSTSTSLRVMARRTTATGYPVNTVALYIQGATVGISKRVNGATTVLASGVSYAVGSVIGLEVIGSTASIYIDGVKKATVTDAAIGAMTGTEFALVAGINNPAVKLTNLLVVAR